MLGYLSLDISCSSKLTVFLELRSRKTVRFSEQIHVMSADKYPSIFSRQMEDIVYMYVFINLYFKIARKELGRMSLKYERIKLATKKEQYKTVPHTFYLPFSDHRLVNQPPS